MVTAELSYNPYLLETAIRFNEQPPHINSLVEKFQKGMLQKWIQKVPVIFHDEMNGYDFELIFSGTDLDFQELQKVFMEAGVGDDQVHLFHKNHLAGRKEKLEKLDELLKWLSEHPNDYFDNASFREDNQTLLTRSDAYVILQGRGFDTSVLENEGIAVEEVESIEKLEDTDLHNTPLLICLDRETLSRLNDVFRYFKSRTDVSPTQLFFYLYPSVEAASVGRIICDLGIANPQIVNRVDDDNIKRYIEIYSTTDYIANAIRILHKSLDKIESDLEKSSAESEQINSGIHDQMEEIESSIDRLKNAKELIDKRGGQEIPSKWNDIVEEFQEGINSWKKKKTRITKEDEAVKQAEELNNLLHQLFDKYVDQMTTAVFNRITQLNMSFTEWYNSAEFDTTHTFNLPEFPRINPDDIPDISAELMKLKEMSYVTPKEDLMGMLFKTGNSEPVLEISYYYQNWREYAWGVVKPAEERFLASCFSAVLAYDEETAKIYSSHLDELIRSQTEQLRLTGANLSAEEQKLQSDISWAREFESKLTEIERG